MKKLNIYRCVTAAITLLWMVFIFSLSNDTAIESDKLSDGTLKFLFTLFYPNFESLSLLKQQELVEPFALIIRKFAHFVLYFILGVLSSATLVSYRGIPYAFRGVISGAICVIFAITDEIHQLFVDGRSGEVADVLLDSTASIIGILVFYVILQIFIKRRERKCAKSN